MLTRSNQSLEGRKRTKKQNKTKQREKIKHRKVWEMRLRHIDLF